MTLKEGIVAQKIKTEGLKISDHLLTVVEGYNSVAEVPEKVLAREGLVKVYVERTNRWKLIREDLLRGMVAVAWQIGERYKGYLSATHLDLLRRIRKRQEILSINTLKKFVERAEDLRQSGIPPIFDKEFYPSSKMVRTIVLAGGDIGVEIKTRFPLVDFIIEFGAGTYFARLRKQMASRWHQGLRDHRFVVPPALKDEVLAFRESAFLDARTIDPVFVREVQCYIKSHFHFKSDESEEAARARDQKLLPFLEEKLSSMRFQKKEWKVWDGDVTIVGHWGWYKDFCPKDRITIVRAFLASLPGHPDRKQRRALDRVTALFPELCGTVAEDLRRKARAEFLAGAGAAVAQARAEGNFRSIPPAVYVEAELWARHGAAIKAAFREACRELAKRDEPALFGNVYEKLDIEIQAKLACLYELKEIVDTVRLEVVKVMSDELFVELFGGRGGRRSCIGNSKSVESSAAGALRKYVNDRWKALRK